MRLTSGKIGYGLRFAFSMLVFGVLAGCGSSSLPPVRPTLVSIEVTPSNSVIAIGTTENFTATGVYADSSTRDITSSVNWGSSNANVVTMNKHGEGSATAMETGNVTITAMDRATQIQGNTKLTVTSAVLSQLEITPTNPTIALGTTKQLTATGVFSDSTTQNMTASVDWASSNAAIATVGNDVTDKGLANGLAQGSATITAMDPASGLSASSKLSVNAANLVSISITPANPSVALGTTEQFTAMGTYSDASTQDITTAVTWGSGNTAVATISNSSGSKGLAHSSGQGNATITATDAASGISANTMLRVTAAELNSIEISPANSSLVSGVTRQFNATGVFSDNSTQDITTSVTWSSSDASIAAISNATGSKGVAVSIKPGTVTITATDPASGVTSGTSLNVTAAVLTSISIAPVSPSVSVGAAQQFIATGAYSDLTTQDITTSVTWSSSDPSVATISNATGSQGLATSVATGSVTILAQDAASGLTAQTTLQVSATMLMSIAISPANASIARGASQQFTATGTYTDASTQDVTAAVAWSSSNNRVATISNAVGSEGLAVGVQNGVATISAVDPETNIAGLATLAVFFVAR